MAYEPEWITDTGPSKLNELQPEMFRKFLEFEDAVYHRGKIPAKYKELMAVGITHVTQCEACMAYHTHNAKLAGATDEEIAEAAFVAMELRAGAAMAHFRASARVLGQHRHE
jgi:AhpD family alkylhydroperoxidase